MAATNQKPLVQFEKDSILPDLPTDQQMNELMLEVLSFLQQWGVIFCIIFFLICLVQVQLFKARKNPQAQKYWKFLGWGMVFLSSVFALLPYIVLKFY